jgi:hypothetical protein
MNKIKMSKPKPTISKEKLYSVYMDVLTKMAKYAELFGTEEEVGILLPIGCKKGIQVFIKAIRIKKSGNKFYY